MFTNYTFRIMRKLAPLPGTWGDPTRTEVGTFLARRQPVEAPAAIKLGQDGKLPKEVLFYTGTTLDLLSTDELLDPDGVTWYIISKEVYRNGLLPHIEVYVTDVQWVAQ